MAVDDPNVPDHSRLPLQLQRNPPTGTANGNYTFTVQRAPIDRPRTASLVPSSPITFTLNDTTAPEVASTSIFSRIVTIKFTKAMAPTTITLANFFVVAGRATRGTGYTRSTSTAIPGSRSPTTRLTNTATLDYSGLPQTEMPTDDYAIVVMSGATGVTDLVGNELDGAFSGSFPLGQRHAGQRVSSRTSGSRRSRRR